MKQKNESKHNGKLNGVEPALRRASQRAREIAARTGTPLVIYSDGKIKELVVRREPEPKSA